MNKKYNGVIKSPEDKRDWKITRCIDIPAGSVLQDVPKKFKVYVPIEIYNQENTNSCTAFAMALIFECIWHKLYHEKREFSKGYSYGNRRLTIHKGEGQIMRDVIKESLEYGDIFTNIWENNSEVPKIIDEFEKVFESISDHAKNLISGYVRINDADEAKVFLYRYKVPLFVSTEIKYINPLTKSGALHAMACYGYDNDTFYCRNSWGKYDCVNPDIKFKNFNEVWGIIPMEEKTFNDIDSARWSASAIQEAVKDGIIQGFPNGNFEPEKPLTREQMAIIWERMKRYIEEQSK